MKPIEEQVQLPDPEQQFFVHPLDLPAARGEYLKGWWLGIVATPQMFTALLAALWVISNNRVTPVLVPLVLTVVAGFVGSQFTRAAWDYIPRRRHDRHRRMTRLALAAASIKALSLLAGLVIFLFWADAQGFSGSFSSYPLGMSAALVLILAIDLVVGLGRGRSEPGDILGGLLTLLAAAAAVWGGFALLPDPADSLPWTGLLAGAATLAVVWVGWLGYSAWQTQRNHG
ncbi:hypothetical protein [uncultured Arthrobacter sp.]|mgnify:CR=1 FL=1|uniref:hypothetical protein n=1 Tax=uncultured Arthrobacter sp. TaxID=114050 RepID=UPI003217ADD9